MQTHFQIKGLREGLCANQCRFKIFLRGDPSHVTLFRTFISSDIHSNANFISDYTESEWLRGILLLERDFRTKTFLTFAYVSTWEITASQSFKQFFFFFFLWQTDVESNISDISFHCSSAAQRTGLCTERGYDTDQKPKRN